MICPKCGNEFQVQLAMNVKCKGCRILTNNTTILTVQCEKCSHVFQFPVNSKSMLSVKRDED